MPSFIAQAVLQGNGGRFAEPHLPPGGTAFQYNHVAYVHFLNLL